MVRNYQKRVRTHSEADNEALSLIHAGSSVNSVAKQTGIGRQLMCNRLATRAGKREPVGHSGSHHIIFLEDEHDLANCIVEMGNYGFPPSRKQIRSIVAEFADKRNS